MQPPCPGYPRYIYIYIFLLLNSVSSVSTIEFEAPDSATEIDVIPIPWKDPVPSSVEILWYTLSADHYVKKSGSFRILESKDYKEADLLNLITSSEDKRQT